MYDLVYVDPPWAYTNFGTASASSHYALMDQESLISMDVKTLLNKKAAVLMWATGPRLDYAIDLIRGWGLHYRGIAFVWVKTRSDGQIIHGQGVPPTFTKPNVELVLLATTTKRGRPIKLRKYNTPQVVLHKKHKHSQKPEVFREMIEETFVPGIKKLEIFGRRDAADWDVLGNEIDGQDIHESIRRLLDGREEEG